VASWAIATPSAAASLPAKPIGITFTDALTRTTIASLEQAYSFRTDEWTVVGHFDDGSQALTTASLSLDSLPPLGQTVTEPGSGQDLEYAGVLFVRAELTGGLERLHDLQQDQIVRVVDSTGIQALLDIVQKSSGSLTISSMDLPQQYFDMPWAW
jgi:hypothetical protein